MQARYYWHPVRHAVVEEYFKSVRDRTRANNMLLHLSDALVRSSMIEAKKLSSIGMSEGEDFEVQRIRISESKYPALYRLYTSSPSRLRGYIFGEILAEAARFRQEKPDEAGMIVLNLTASLEEVGDDAYPQLVAEVSDREPSHRYSPQRPDGEEREESKSSGDQEEDRVNGLGQTLLSSISIDGF